MKTNTNKSNLPAIIRNSGSGPAKQGNLLPERYSGISPFLSKHDLGFVKAARAIKVSDLSQPDALKGIIECMNIGYAELGLTPPGSHSENRKEHLVGMANLIITDLAFYFPQVTLAEVVQAIRKGIRKEYGEYYGYNVIAIHFFVEEYLKSEERAAAMERQERYRQSQEASENLTPGQQRQILLDGLKQCLETYRKTGRIIDFGHVNYQLLVDDGRINLTNEQKQEIYEIAEWQIQREKETQELSLSKQLYLIKNPPDNKPEVISRAKELSLKKYFDSLEPPAGVKVH